MRVPTSLCGAFNGYAIIHPVYLLADKPLQSGIERIAIYLSDDGDYWTDDFKPKEFRCKCRVCKQLAPHPFSALMVARAQMIRNFLKRPTTISSAYRCPNHNVEAKKIKKGKRPGSHSRAHALDIKVSSGAEAGLLIQFAITVLGCTGFSYYAKGGFVHLDWHEMVRTWNY